MVRMSTGELLDAPKSGTPVNATTRWPMTGDD
jgi:hypothetical protein